MVRTISSKLLGGAKQMSRVLKLSNFANPEESEFFLIDVNCSNFVFEPSTKSIDQSRLQKIISQDALKRHPNLSCIVPTLNKQSQGVQL